MDLDDELCLCFHVTRRKVENFIRQSKPQRASQLSECFGAGTGCGWCRPFLHRLWRRAQPDMAGDDSESKKRGRATVAPSHHDDRQANSPGTAPTTDDRLAVDSDPCVHGPNSPEEPRSKTDEFDELPSVADYARQREVYRQQRGER